MNPSFTNIKRLNVYMRDTRRGGFDYINWDIEEELWRFQKEIEMKFAVSDINKKFKFPLIGSHDIEVNRYQEHFGTANIQRAGELRSSAQRKDAGLSSS